MKWSRSSHHVDADNNASRVKVGRKVKAAAKDAVDVVVVVSADDNPPLHSLLLATESKKRPQKRGRFLIQ